MKTIQIEVTYRYELEIDEENYVVKDYDDESDMLYDCASYRFDRTLPVIEKGGVRVVDVEVMEIQDV